MAVRVLKTVASCKLCAADDPAAVNDALEKYSKRELTRDGMLQALADAGVKNPNVDNAKAHRGQKGNDPHIEFVAAAELEKENAAVIETAEAILRGEIEYEDVDEGLRFLATAYLRQQKQKFEQGESLGISHDQFIKLVDSMTKRKHNDAQDEVLQAIAGGIGQVFTKAIEGEVHAELEAVTPENAEFEVIDDA